MDKYQHYEDASCGLLSELQACEVTASKHLSEPIAVDPKNLQRQLEETKVKRNRDREKRKEIQPFSSLTENLSLYHTLQSFHQGRGPKDRKRVLLSLGRVLTHSSQSINEIVFYTVV